MGVFKGSTLGSYGWLNPPKPPSFLTLLLYVRVSLGHGCVVELHRRKMKISNTNLSQQRLLYIVSNHCIVYLTSRFLRGTRLSNTNLLQHRLLYIVSNHCIVYLTSRFRRGTRRQTPCILSYSRTISIITCQQMVLEFHPSHTWPSQSEVPLLISHPSIDSRAFQGAFRNERCFGEILSYQLKKYMFLFSLPTIQF